LCGEPAQGDLLGTDGIESGDCGLDDLVKGKRRPRTRLPTTTSASGIVPTVTAWNTAGATRIIPAGAAWIAAGGELITVARPRSMTS